MHHVPTFAETDPLVLRELMHAHPLATLITLASTGLNANPMPLIWHDDGSEFGTLRGHCARANALWQDYSVEHGALAVFQGHTAYISPSWYATKSETHKVVPTYNYATVQAQGELVIHDDATWLLALLNDLTDSHEAKFNTPWSVNDAPADYISQMMRAIVGFEIKIKSLMGKWKVSQNQPARNQAGVSAGLQESGNHDMAAYVAAKLK